MAMFIAECCTRLLCYNHTWYRVDMVSVKLASFYQSRPSMYMSDSAELAEGALIDSFDIYTFGL